MNCRDTFNCLAGSPRCQCLKEFEVGTMPSSAEAPMLAAGRVQDCDEPTQPPPLVVSPFAFGPQPASPEPPGWAAIALFSLISRCKHTPGVREIPHRRESGHR